MKGIVIETHGFLDMERQVLLNKDAVQCPFMR